MSTLSEFRISITNEMCHVHSASAWRRFCEFIEEQDSGGEIIGREDYEKNSWTYTGKASVEVITAIQAAARGDDLDRVLDLLSSRDPSGAAGVDDATADVEASIPPRWNQQ